MGWESEPAVHRPGTRAGVWDDPFLFFVYPPPGDTNLMGLNGYALNVNLEAPRHTWDADFSRCSVMRPVELRLPDLSGLVATMSPRPAVPVSHPR